MTVVVWDERALEDWRRLNLKDARAVAAAVDGWAESGAGVVISVDGEFRLFVGVYVVTLLVDGATVYVDRLRRA